MEILSNKISSKQCAQEQEIESLAPVRAAPGNFATVTKERIGSETDFNSILSRVAYGNFVQQNFQKQNFQGAIVGAISGRPPFEEITQTDLIDDQIQKLQNKLNWNYKHIASTKIITKSSVSKIKQMDNMEEVNEELSFSEPKFLKDEIEISSARKGTLTHLVLQKLNKKEDYTVEKIAHLIEDLTKREIITEKEAKCINVNKIYSFTKSDIFNQLRKAKKVYKEQPFYINVPANMIYDEDIDEEILVQGIIDLYYVTEDDKVILVDYKTDYVPEGNENILKEKYQKQLELYQKAIEGRINRKVDNIYIYSTYLEKIIEL